MEQIKDKQWAKDLSLKVWRWLRDHPSCDSKEDTPFLSEISGLELHCPLCELSRLSILSCASTCPLTLCSTRGKNTGFYLRWRWARSIKTRHLAASVIVKRLEQWDITGGEE